jgi:MoxR-like ATPase
MSKKKNTAPAAPLHAVASPMKHAVAAKRMLDEMQSVLIGRDEEAHGVVLAALAGEHAVLIGPPGTGKSLLSRALCTVTGSSGFEYLMTRFTAPDELFGPVSITGLKNDRHERVVTGRLPEAEIAFLDEIWKANSSVLNSLLTAMNERIFVNGTTTLRIPLRTVVAASNEYPKPDVQAVWDRFLVRMHVDYLTDPDHLMDLLEGEQRGFPKAAPIITLATWDAMRAEAATVTISPTIHGELVRLRQELLTKGHPVGDRRFIKAMPLLRASAYLDGRTEVAVSDLRVLRHSWWTTEKSRAEVKAIVEQFAAPHLAEARELYDAVMEKYRDWEGTSAEPFDIMSRLQRAERAISKLSSEGGSPDIDRLAAKVGAKYAALLQQETERLGGS